jgi:hypothetical protein
MPAGDGRLAPMPPAPPGRGGIPAGRGAPVPGPAGRGTPGTAPGASGGRGAVDACEVKGLLPMRGGPDVARGTAGPGRGPAAGRAAPESPGRLTVGAAAGVAAWAAGATGARKTSVDGLTRSGADATVAAVAGGAATGATTTGGASTARGLSAVRAVAAALGAAGGAATAAGAGKDSLSLRTTGASIVEEAERTNSPNS